ncbi:MAG: hypothetical protein WCR49_15140 [Opitutae bacterium]
MKPDERVYPKTTDDLRQLLLEARQLPLTSPLRPRSLFNPNLSSSERSKGYEMFSAQVARIRQHRQEVDSLPAGS